MPSCGQQMYPRSAWIEILLKPQGLRLKASSTSVPPVVGLAECQRSLSMTTDVFNNEETSKHIKTFSCFAPRCNSFELVYPPAKQA